jgi:hypothetical protein
MLFSVFVEVLNIGTRRKAATPVEPVQLHEKMRPEQPADSVSAG